MLSKEEKNILSELGYHMQMSGLYMFKTLTIDPEVPVYTKYKYHRVTASLFIDCETRAVTVEGDDKLVKTLLNELNIYIKNLKI